MSFERIFVVLVVTAIGASAAALVGSPGTHQHLRWTNVASAAAFSMIAMVVLIGMLGVPGFVVIQ